MLVTLVTLLFYTKCVYCANILGVFVYPTISHQSVFQVIWKELSLKGHKVTVVTPDPLNDDSLTNLTEISVSHAYEIYKNNKLNDVIPTDASIFEFLYLIYRVFDVILKMEMDSTQFQELLRDKNENFDLILAECHYPILYSLAQKFQAPIIRVCSFGAMVSQNYYMGNSHHPLLYPDPYIKNQNENLALKVNNVLFALWNVFHYKYLVLPRAHKMAKKYFGDDIPYLGDLEKDVSLLYLNKNLLITYTGPSVPAMVDMGQVHLKPVKPLPKDLLQIMDEAQEGVIYFSLGNTMRSADLGKNLVKIISEALAELPYKVIWKWDLDHLPDKPSNVIISKWLPQQDLLAHPNIRAFVTQGGMQSIDEAIARAVPLVVMPLIFDQFMHMQKVVDLGIGLGVELSTITKEELSRSITEVIENVSYKKRIEKVRGLLFDRQMSGIEKAVWWPDYVIRHRGAKFLRSSSADISWFQFFMIDVVLVLITVATILSYAVGDLYTLLYNYWSFSNIDTDSFDCLMKI